VHFVAWWHHAGNPQETGGGEDGAEKEAKKKKVIYRTAAGERWRDDTLAEWPESAHLNLHSQAYSQPPT